MKRRVLGLVGFLMTVLLQVFPERVTVKEFWELINICWSYDKNLVVYFFDSECSSNDNDNNNNIIIIIPKTS